MSDLEKQQLRTLKAQENASNAEEQYWLARTHTEKNRREALRTNTDAQKQHLELMGAYFDVLLKLKRGEGS